MLTGTIAGICEYFGWSPDIIYFCAYLVCPLSFRKLGKPHSCILYCQLDYSKVLEVMLGDKTTAEQMKKTGQAMRTVGKANLHLTHLVVR